MRKNFIKKQEDFECVVCGVHVVGTGYTNHCPECLSSLHVDEFVPGDRKSRCKEIMDAISVDQKEGKFVIIHKCRKCGKLMRNKVSVEDNIDILAEIASRQN